MIAEFATVVGLLSAFSSGRRGEGHADITEFLSWLSEHKHDKIRASIEGNQTAVTSIRTLLDTGFDDVQRKLNDISDRMAILASRSEGIEDLAVAYAKASISDQSLELLTLMEEKETKFFLLSYEIGSREQRVILSPGPNYICKEARFLRDDLALMVELGLLIQDLSSRGDPMYYFTRAASRLVRSTK